MAETQPTPERWFEPPQPGFVPGKEDLSRKRAEDRFFRKNPDADKDTSEQETSH